MKLITRLAAAVAAAAFIAGCAVSPQSIDIAPLVKTPPPSLGGGRTLALEVIDERPQPHFGTLGGVYAGTAHIRPTGDIAPPIREALASALGAAGFQVQPRGAPGEISMVVAVEEVSYHGSGSPRINKIETLAAISLDARGPKGEYNGRSKVKQTKDVILTPTQADNQQLVNDAISNALERLLARQELIDYLGR